MKKTRKKHLLPALLCTALLAGAVLAPHALAVEAADETAGTSQAAEQTAGDTASAAAEATSSEIHTYNLASEDWDGLLAGEDEGTASRSGKYVGDRSSDGGSSKMLIIAIIAFALGGVGVLFFIYSQFIYKAKLRREAEEKQKEDQARDERTHDLQEKFHIDKKEEPKETPAEPEPETEAPKDPEEKEEIVSAEDEKKLNEVDWDAFFDKNEEDDK